MTTTAEPFFITTPIYYVNAAPHLGTAYCTILCDVMARYKRLMGYDVKFLTGMDEHGQKVAEAAAAHKLSPQEWCDSQAPLFKSLWKTLNISYDDFIRTTEPRQHAAVQYLWERMKESGYLYKGSYDGWYCVPEETYFTETQVEKSDDEKGTKGEHLCPDCGRPLQRVQEESYFFKLSAFQDRLLALYEEHPDFIEPDFRMNEVKSFVAGGLNDLSVSRTSFDWGIQVPFDTKHVTYVWFDALLNYMTAVGFGQEGQANAELFARRWPADFHVVGKDIIRFHCVIWPAMLMAIDEALPKHVFTHGFLLVKNAETGRGEKMSKSRGNAIAPQEVIDLLGVDGYRYYFMTDVTHGEDSSISYERMYQVYNADLANSWGNLVSRTISMSAKYFEGKTPLLDASWATAQDGTLAAQPLRAVAQQTFELYTQAMEKLNYVAAKDAVMELIHAANHFIEDAAPWAVAKDESRKEELALIIAQLLESIRVAAHYLTPFMPTTSADVLERLGSSDEVGTTDLKAATTWGALKLDVEVTKGAPLFARLEQEA